MPPILTIPQHYTTQRHQSQPHKQKNSTIVFTNTNDTTRQLYQPVARTTHARPVQLYIIHKSSRSASIAVYKFANEIKQKLNKKTGQTEHLPHSKHKL